MGIGIGRGVDGVGTSVGHEWEWGQQRGWGWDRVGRGGAGRGIETRMGPGIRATTAGDPE